MNCIKNLHGTKTNMISNEEYLRDHRCDGRDKIYKCKIFMAAT